VTIIPARVFRRLPLLAVAVPLALGLSACGRKLKNPHRADNEGVYVDAGSLSYQVQLSRALNPASKEDRSYLTGVTASPPTPSQVWFAVFMWAKNETHANHTTTDSFDIIDSQNHRYYPVTLNPSLNSYAWTSQTLRPLDIEPSPDTTASFGPTQGAEVLFKLDTTVYSNRPLTLEIRAPGQAEPSAVSLDL
jgi:hypothetical protein